MKVGINGMGRIGRLALRAAMGAAERPHDDPRAGHRLDVVHCNELQGGAAAGGRGGGAIAGVHAKLARGQGGCTRWAGVTSDLRSKLLV